ncbi:MAG: ABC transporter permease [Planctomycetes bacterium]|nr:ABC transporter permease [Planctomycetota bacterium]
MRFVIATLKMAVGSLALNKLRSLLSMLGVIIGVGAVIAMLSLGSAFGDYISSQITVLGTNVLFVRAGQFQHGPLNTMQTLTVEDCEAIMEIPGVRAVTPLASTSATLKAGGNATNTAMIWGVAPSLGEIQDCQIQRGRMFNDAEVRRQARVAVLGPKSAQDLFGDAEPISQSIRIRGVSFEVIGLTKAVGDQGGFNPDDRAIIPYTTCMKQLPPRRDFLPMIMVSTFDKADLPTVTAGMTDTLRHRHHMHTQTDDDFSIRNMAEILDTFQAVSLGLTMFLGTVAGISLIVGGIGIMNIMLATVAERTREIGTRKAIGAKERDIMSQFLIEALVITLGGGVVGLALGWGLMEVGAGIVRRWLTLDPTLQWWSVALSVVISTLVGLCSGLYPAWRASRLDPIVALRCD